MILNEREFTSKVLGCWLGKNIGGTLGAPFEWRRQVNHVSFYTQELDGNPLPNDDLDIQLLWLVALEECGVDLDAKTLAEYWCLYVTPHWSEYGTAKVNMRSGLVPPLSGTFNNDYKDSCGAFIRSEIWACIAPGNPRTAAWYAYQDAILDHGDGEGVYAEIFCAVMESTAFIEQDISRLIDIGLAYIPSDCGVAGAVKEAVACFEAGMNWQEARDRILEKYRGLTFFGFHHHTSEEDWQKGHGDGKRGWDAPSNIGMLVIGLLYGKDDFGKTVCTAVNCGEDTDCTAATAGALWGILHGSEAIPPEWIAPIGSKIKTACLNLGELGYFGDQLPSTVEEMTRRTVAMSRQVILRRNLALEFSDDQPSDYFQLKTSDLEPDVAIQRLLDNLKGPIYHYDFFEIAVEYGEGPFLRIGQPTQVKLRIYNTYKIQTLLHLRWYTSSDWQILPGREGSILSLPTHLGEPLELAFEIRAEVIQPRLNRAVIEICLDSRPGVMLVPVALMNASLLAL